MTDEAHYYVRLQFGNNYHAQLLYILLENKRLISDLFRTAAGECLANAIRREYILICAHILYEHLLK
jgi:hypothetical protein